MPLCVKRDKCTEKFNQRKKKVIKQKETYNNIPAPLRRKR